MKRSTLSTIYLVGMSLLLVLAFQNCSKVGFMPDSSATAFKTADGLRSAGDDGILGNADDRLAGDDGVLGTDDDTLAGDDPNMSDDDDSMDDEDDSDWLYIPGGRGHVPMSSVAICPADSKDAGKQKCPIFCYKGVDYVMHKSLARDYFAKKFDELPNYGGGAVPGTCAAPDLKTKK